MPDTQVSDVRQVEVPAPEIQTVAISACKDVVKRFRMGNISRTRATVEIQRNIPYTGSFDDEDALTAHSVAIQSFTVEILGAINVDIKRAKADLLLSLDVPQFPESQWTKLLSGATADFDHVLSGLYASADVEHATERIGSLEFSYTNTVLTKRVSNFGDWTTAFESFSDAFTFIFLHRIDEV
ncbi:hypothetical protein FISHEDRAFT_75820 [Fistulina hepatica ATCC 64428]|uniref:Uncharacterized protein n=1 Tax=Fistulina hepatica ATCC 64428 TaxID=1128425 RepID=A0A0D7A783_9AGAR|nr:hypothetical protein FISHEDRAFT_75820 [Fistulina hepatica ATCC 64428]